MLDRKQGVLNLFYQLHIFNDLVYLLHSADFNLLNYISKGDTIPRYFPRKTTQHLHHLLYQFTHILLNVSKPKMFYRNFLYLYFTVSTTASRASGYVTLLLVLCCYVLQAATHISCSFKTLSYVRTRNYGNKGFVSTVDNHNIQ